MAAARPGLVYHPLVAGGLLLLAAVAAVITANVAPTWYADWRGTYYGGTVFGLDLKLSIAKWAADGLLAVFFFIIGLELKREITHGALRNPADALAPIIAAIGGVVVPAVLYVAIVSATTGGGLRGWAIPAATDIAFALAVLAVFGRGLPAALRMFLLTLAVVDDLIAITIIAVVYTENINLGALGGSLIPLALFAVIAYLLRRRLAATPALWWVTLMPFAVACWALFYASGVHATIAGVLLGLVVPAQRHDGTSAAAALEHHVAPLSNLVCLPLFAFAAAGVTLSDVPGAQALMSGAGLAIIVALVVGKITGITGGAWIATRLRPAALGPDLDLVDVVALAALAGIGFTVSLLIADLSFTDSAEMAATAKAAILLASVIAATIGGTLLRLRARQRNQAPAPRGV